MYAEISERGGVSASVHESARAECRKLENKETEVSRQNSGNQPTVAMYSEISERGGVSASVHKSARAECPKLEKQGSSSSGGSCKPGNEERKGKWLHVQHHSRV